MKPAEEVLTPILGCSVIAAMTWFFSTRPRLFMRVFVPAESRFAFGRQALGRHRVTFRRGMRQMAGLQFAAGWVLGACLAAWRF
ncbi:MAG: hypothetical protein C0501_11065 [Isosphaera sp.]|nr:hypothetical protein [Isosphaera sp.]